MHFESKVTCSSFVPKAYSVGSSLSVRSKSSAHHYEPLHSNSAGTLTNFPAICGSKPSQNYLRLILSFIKLRN
ncbi:hypothetical protein L6164_024437 [Bauhinia variegata]|uniref:Uncharacterized protein n=1 Tax=Bauhinia variegata TaxID=167791 RepID=A0ACB9LZ13_BAUVA|nr:hypothetical protein L6164_024437 [Bauhinia variegata]